MPAQDATPLTGKTHLPALHNHTHQQQAVHSLGAQWDSQVTATTTMNIHYDLPIFHTNAGKVLLLS